VKDLVFARDEAEVLLALHRTQQTRPENALGFFKAFLKKQPLREVIPAASGHPLAGSPGVMLPDDPYA
ncbi:MAG TPA: hypothetical protein VK864_16245, partial [Longimicrobiales bacterium]|nr:hypothetical protein [Longimicrobiales bacterium]